MGVVGIGEIKRRRSERRRRVIVKRATRTASLPLIVVHGRSANLRETMKEVLTEQQEERSA